MGNRGHSEPNVFGGYTHYDEMGNKIGSSEPDFLGGFIDYDAKGNRTGYSDPDPFGGYTHYDSEGNKTGYSGPDVTGGYSHYDEKGNRRGYSNPDVFGGFSNEDDGPCYIATCVYGSYNCPEVWTLRRFRDYRLMESSAGRLFVRFYYAVSPTVVRLFGNNRVFRKFWRGVLDRWVLKLQEKGYDDSPYCDKVKR